MRILIALPISITILSCSSKAIAQDGEIPNSIGNSFVYAVTDSNMQSVRHYEVKVSVVGLAKLFGDKDAKIWKLVYPDFIDTIYVVSNKDSITFYDKARKSTNNTVHLPLKAGQKWKQPTKNGNVTVSEITAIKVSGKSFNNVLLILETGSAPNYSYSKEQFIVPHIGLIKMILREKYFLSPSVQVWQLINYKL